MCKGPVKQIDFGKDDKFIYRSGNHLNETETIILNELAVSNKIPGTVSLTLNVQSIRYDRLRCYYKNFSTGQALNLSHSKVFQDYKNLMLQTRQCSIRFFCTDNIMTFHCILVTISRLMAISCSPRSDNISHPTSLTTQCYLGE